MNQSSTKQTCFVLANTGDSVSSNISVGLSGISSGWYISNATFFSSIAVNGNETTCFTFSIPSTATPADYPSILIASDNVSGLANFILRVDQANSATKDQANLSLENARLAIQNATAAGKDVTVASNDYNTSVDFFYAGDYYNAKIYADRAYNDAQNAPSLIQPTVSYNLLIYVALATFGVLILVFLVLFLKGRNPREKVEEIQEKWTEVVKKFI